MTFLDLIKEATTWLGWSSLGLILICSIAFLVSWGARFRLFGALLFNLLLWGSCLVFSTSYKPPYVVEGAKYAPVVFDNGNDLVVAQASKDFPEDAVQPTLEQIAGNLKGGNRTGGLVKIRLRQLIATKPGTSEPVIMGEAIRDLKEQKTKYIDQIQIKINPVIEEEVTSYKDKEYDEEAPIDDSDRNSIIEEKGY